MSSDEEQQAINPEDEDDVNFQLNPFDDQGDDDNENEDSSHGVLEQSGENFVNKLIGNGDEGDTQNENETAPKDEEQDDENNVEDHETRPDEGDEDQETTPDNDDENPQKSGHLNETGEEIINQLTGEDDKKNANSSTLDGDDHHNENATAPDEEDDQQNENATAPDDGSDNDDQKANENNNDERVNKGSSKKGKKSDKDSKNSDKKGKVEKASQNMINQLIGGDDEHQTAEDFHSKSSNEEDNEEKDTSDSDDESDDESEKNDSDKESKKEQSDDESEKDESDKESKKEQSDDESEKDESDKESTKDKSDDESDKSDSDKDNQKDQDDDNKDNPDELTDDFDDEGDGGDPSMMITEASNVIKPPKTPKQHTARKKPIFPPQPTYSDEEIIDQINIMMKDKKLPDSCYHQPIRNYISREQFAASEQHNYQRAELLESYLDMLTDLLNQIDTTEQEEIRRKSIEEKIQKVNENHQEFVRKWNKEWNDKTQEQEKTKQSMEERQELEITDFKRRCSEDTFIQKFNKPSQTLINLRKAENQMAMSKLFDRAKALKKKADELQKTEQTEAQKRMNDNVYTQYQLMESRHQREKECFEQHNQSIFETLEKKRDKEQRNYEMAITMLKAQLDPPPNRDRVEIIKPQTAKRPIRNNRTIQNIKSPAALDIQTVDFSKFTKTRKIIKPTTASASSRKNSKK